MAKKPAPKKAASKGSAVRRATAPPKDEREEDRVKDWFGKIRGADKAYEEWEKRFSVKRGEDYYEGRQWYGLPEADADKRYVINITAAAVETQKPSLLFDNPQIRIEPRPSRKDELSRQTLDDEAKLATQAVQTFIDDPDVKFILETGLGVHEAHFRFGLVEVGYTADFLDNPHAGKPLIPSDPTKAGELPEGAGENTVDTEAEDAATEAGADGEAEAGPLQPDKVVQPGTERIYVKRVPAESFRVSLSGKNDLSANDWVGYFEWVYVSDLKANAKYKNTDDLKSTGTIDQKYRPSANSQDLEAKHGMVKVWKLWDLRGKVKHVLADGHQKFLLEGEPWKIVPFADLKFLERPNHYYPKPVVFDWQLAGLGPGVLDLAAFITGSEWERRPLPIARDELIALYRAEMAQRLNVQWTDDHWALLWDSALLWRFTQEMFGWAASAPREEFTARAAAFRDIWLDPALAAAARRLRPVLYV